MFLGGNIIIVSNDLQCNGQNHQIVIPSPWTPTHLLRDNQSNIFGESFVKFFTLWVDLAKKSNDILKPCSKKTMQCLKHMKCVLLQGINTVHACCVLNKHLGTGTRALFGVEWLQSSAIIAVYPGGSLRRTFRSSTPVSSSAPMRNKSGCLCLLAAQSPWSSSHRKCRFPGNAERPYLKCYLWHLSNK